MYPKYHSSSIVQYDEHAFIWLDETGNVGGAAPTLEEAQKMMSKYTNSLNPPSHETKMLLIDDKYSIVYDPNCNDKPLYVERYGQRHQNIESPGTPNWIIAMFYSLLKEKELNNES